LKIAKRKTAKSTKRQNSPGGAKLLQRVTMMWDGWSDQTIELLIENGIVDPDLLALTARSENPNGQELAPLCIQAHTEAHGLAGELKKAIKLTQFPPDLKKIILKSISEYGAARERAGHLGAQLELLAADELHNTARAKKRARTMAKDGKRAQRLTAIKAYIVQHGHEAKSAYSLNLGYSADIELAIKANGLKMVDTETLKRDLEDVQREIREMT